MPSFSPSLLRSCRFPRRPYSDPQAHIEPLLASLPTHTSPGFPRSPLTPPPGFSGTPGTSAQVLQEPLALYRPPPGFESSRHLSGLQAPLWPHVQGPGSWTPRARYPALLLTRRGRSLAHSERTPEQPRTGSWWPPAKLGVSPLPLVCEEVSGGAGSRNGARAAPAGWWVWSFQHLNRQYGRIGTTSHRTPLPSPPRSARSGHRTGAQERCSGRTS